MKYIIVGRGGGGEGMKCVTGEDEVGSCEWGWGLGKDEGGCWGG